MGCGKVTAMLSRKIDVGGGVRIRGVGVGARRASP